MIRRIIGSPATGIAGLARTSVSGRSRVPSPAVRTSARSIVGARSDSDRMTAHLQETAKELVHREAFECEGGEAEVAGHRHLENLQLLHDRHGVVPLRVRPVVPE